MNKIISNKKNLEAFLEPPLPLVLSPLHVKGQKPDSHHGPYLLTFILHNEQWPFIIIIIYPNCLLIAFTARAWKRQGPRAES